MKTLKFKQIDLSKTMEDGVGGGCHHPDISAGKLYLVKYEGQLILGSFGQQWYGWNFSWFGSAYAGLQLNCLQEVWELVEENLPREKEVREIWVGLYHQVMYHAGQLGIKYPKKIVSKWQDLVGYRGPLKVHLCGEWKKMDEWKQIRNQLTYLSRTGDKIEYIKHHE